jgi:hypothetical protein
MTIQARFNSRCATCGGAILAGEQVDWVRGVGTKHLNTAQCAAAPTIAASAPLSLAPLVAFLTAARTRGLKSPKLRVLHLDGQQELRIGLTLNGVAPGSLSITVGGAFIGCVRPNGATTGRLASDGVLQAHLLRVADAPAQHAKQYAVLTCRCSFCGLQLTDAGSVEVGYGPICAQHWGLPHHAAGTVAPVSVDTEVR